jgi:hypothetical protein
MNLIRSSLCGGRVVRVEVGRERHRGRAVMVGGGGQSKAKQTHMHACMVRPTRWSAPRRKRRGGSATLFGGFFTLSFLVWWLN